MENKKKKKTTKAIILKPNFKFYTCKNNLIMETKQINFRKSKKFIIIFNENEDYQLIILNKKIRIMLLVYKGFT